MEVIRAEVYGLCFGVRDALEVAFAREDAAEITVFGELVHNETVLQRLRAQGYDMVAEDRRDAPLPTEKVLITAHGISNRERGRLEAAGHQLIDTTCPLVRKAHHAVLRLREAGYHPVVIGRPGHVEVRGLVGDVDDYTIVPDVAAAEALALPHRKIGVVCQTTFPEPVAAQIVEVLRRRHPGAEVRFHNTVCEPTRARRRAIAELAERVDAVVVVGGHNSNNSRQLVAAVEAAGVPALLVQGPDDLDPHAFVAWSVVGVTAGTSTLDEVVEAVCVKLRAMNAPHGMVGVISAPRG